MKIIIIVEHAYVIAQNERVYADIRIIHCRKYRLDVKYSCRAAVRESGFEYFPSRVIADEFGATTPRKRDVYLYMRE